MYHIHKNNSFKKTLKFLEGAFTATSMVREDICTVFCGNTENTDTAEEGKSDTHVEEASGEQKLKCFLLSYTKTYPHLSTKPIWPRNLW